MEQERPSAQELLKKMPTAPTDRGRLRVFFGFAAGVGKTYAMLKEAHELLLMGKQVVVGYVEPHKRPETNALLEGLPQIPTKTFFYKGISLAELDVDRVLTLSPEIVLVDELAHSNAPDSRNKKRYQDVEELLNAGIDVITTMNVQHLESLNDIVEEITGIAVKETVPDIFFSQASLKLIDIEPEELIERLETGKIYSDSNTKKALQHFFTVDKLDQLRGLSIQRASNHINRIKAQTVGIQTKFLAIIDDHFPKMNEKSIRWTARFAQELGAEWTVVMVRTEQESDELASLVLAEKLGAQTLTIEEEDALATLVEYTKITGITDIVIGKNLSKKWYHPSFLAELEQRLFKELKEIELHLVPYQETLNKRFAFDWNKLFSGGWHDFYLTIGIVFIAMFITEIMTLLHFGEQNLMLVYIFFVLVVARITAGYFWSAFSSVISVLVFNWFFVEPNFSWAIDKKGYPLTLLIMLLVALMVSNLTVRLKLKATSAMEKEKQMEILYELNKRYVLATKKEELFETTCTYLSRLLNREIIVYDVNGKQQASAQIADEASILIDKEEAGVAFWVGKNQKEAGFGTDTLGGAKGFYLPVVFKGTSLAVIGIRREAKKPLENNQLNYIRLIATQLSVVLEQSLLQEERQHMQIENERERVRSNLLRAISHDLRTPLTAISGVAEALHDDELAPMMKKATRTKLLKDIQDESQWLIRMVENLLSITRINMDTMKVKKTEETTEEIIGSVLQRVKKAYPKAIIKVTMPDELLFINVDPILIEQALFNLIENALRHGTKGTDIFLNISSQAHDVQFQVINQGTIQLEQYHKIVNNLKSKEEIPVDSKNGLGIGLSIVKTIMHAHGGKLEVETFGEQTSFTLLIRKEG